MCPAIGVWSQRWLLGTAVSCPSADPEALILEDPRRTVQPQVCRRRKAPRGAETPISVALAITSPDSTEGRSTRDHRRGRSRTLGRSRRKQGRSRHNSRTLVRYSNRTLVRRSNRNPGHKRTRWTLCHRSPRPQLIRLRDRGPNHPATLELVMVSPRQ